MSGSLVYPAKRSEDGSTPQNKKSPLWGFFLCNSLRVIVSPVRRIPNLPDGSQVYREETDCLIS